jgi:hypothetical protein
MITVTVRKGTKKSSAARGYFEFVSDFRNAHFRLARGAPDTVNMICYSKLGYNLQ